MIGNAGKDNMNFILTKILPTSLKYELSSEVF